MSKRAQTPVEKNTRYVRHGIALLAVLAATTASAAPRLRCQISQGGEMHHLEFAPASSPYSAKAMAINESFRFKAVVLGDEEKVDSIALYTYHQSTRQAVLLHQAKYLAPVPQVAPTPAALTGWHFLYAPGLERELQYGCALFEVKP